MFLIERLTRVRIGFQVGAVGVQDPAIRHPAAQGLLHNMVKNLLEDIAVIKAADTVLAQCGGVGDFFDERHAQEPAVGHIDLDFLHQTAFRGETEEVAQRHNFYQADGVDGGSAVVGAIEVGHGVADKFKVDGSVNLPDQMVVGNQLIQGDGFKLVLLRGSVSEHGGQSINYPDPIRSKSRSHDQDCVSNLHGT